MMVGKKDQIVSISSSGKSADPMKNNLNISLNHLWDGEHIDMRGNATDKLNNMEAN